MANPEHLNILKQGFEAWNQWRKESSVSSDLSGEDLRNADLVVTDLHRADLRDANLGNAKLYRAKLEEANLRNAKLIQADLREANLHGANISFAKLSGADLSGAHLHRADLTMASLGSAKLQSADLTQATLQKTYLHEADLSRARIGYTKLANVDLSTVKGIETIQHISPSSIGIDTIYKSHGKIPEIFLRGAGVPDNFIEYMHSLVGAAFEFYSCFISYSSRDQEFAQRLYADLQAKGVRCWFAPHDVQAGKKLHEQIDHAISIHEKVLLVLSLDSMNSEWVKTEIAKARKREAAEKKQILFPIRLVDFEVISKWECFDADMGKDSAREVREYFVPDFSNWLDHHSYQQAFERVLKDLQAEKSKEAGVP